MTKVLNTLREVKVFGQMEQRDLRMMYLSDSIFLVSQGSRKIESGMCLVHMNKFKGEGLCAWQELSR